jgi:hypothetical protein
MIPFVSDSSDLNLKIKMHTIVIFHFVSYEFKVSILAKERSKRMSEVTLLKKRF